jgi:hypothetical protein
MTSDEIIQLHDEINKVRQLKAFIDLHMPKAAEQVIDDLLEGGMSLRQLALRIGRSPAYLSMVNNGHSDCSHETFLKLFEVWTQREQQ